MLSEDEKLHIREEEILRNEIRKQLDRADLSVSKSSTIWKYMNSPFFLWFVSSVVLAAASFSYGHWEKQHAVEQERRLTTRKLDAEIASRLRYFSALYQVGTREGAPQGHDTKLKALLSLEKPSQTEYPINVFPEYANRSFRSLLWELVQVVPESERKGVDTADGAATKLSSSYLTWKESPPPTGSAETKFDQLRQIIDLYVSTGNEVLLKAEIMEPLNLDRWGRPFDTILQEKNGDTNRAIGH